MKRYFKDMKGLQFPTILSVIILTLHLYVYVSPVEAFSKQISSVGYGFNCSETLKCDVNKSLSCVNKSCQCSHPETMVYEPGVSSCGVAAHKPCIVDNPVSPTRKRNATNLKGQTQRQLSCVKNAHCDSILKKCVCEENYRQLANGSCTPKSLHGQTCSASSDCREDLALICNETVCVCDPDKTFYSKFDPNVCVGQAEKPCVVDLCTVDARCVNLNDAPVIEDEEMESVPSTIKNSAEQSTSSMKVCSCFDGYDPTPSGACAKDYGVVCDEVHACKPWLRCGEGGSCECPHPMNQFYDENAAACISKVRGPCNANFTMDFEIGIICIVGAECVNGMNSSENGSSSSSIMTKMTQYCRCKEGYEENSEGGCDLAFGSKCSNETGVNLPCYRKGNLRCIDGRCGCKQPLYQYDEEVKACVGRVGAMCTITTIMATSTETNTNDTKENRLKIGCIKGARCEGLEKATEVPYAEKEDLSEGVCQCIEEIMEDEGGCNEQAPAARYIIITSAIVFGMAVAGSICYVLFKQQLHRIDGLSN